MKILDKISKIINLFESKEFWQKVYDKGETHWLDKQPSNLTKKVIKRYKSFNRILEIGCGAGIDTFLLATIVKDKIYGIDIIDKAIKIAKTNLTKQPKNIQDKIKFETGDAEKLKYEDDFFDFVYSLSVLHSTDINKSLKEVHRVLTEDGKAVIYIFTDNNEGIKEKTFYATCEKYFTITEKQKVDVKDSGKDTHKALIVFLEVK